MAHDEQKEDELFTCQNVSCKRSFVKPLRAFDIGTNSGESYEACPFCLSKVEATCRNVPTPSFEKTSVSSERTVACIHHLGYLCERAEKDQIPDECMLCPEIVSCMLHSLRK